MNGEITNPKSLKGLCCVNSHHHKVKFKLINLHLTTLFIFFNPIQGLGAKFSFKK